MERTAFILYLFVLTISPLLFGARHTWVYTLVFLAILLASTLLLVKHNLVRTESGYAFCWPRTGMTPLFVLFVLFLIFQMTPLPEFLLWKLSPEARIAGTYSLAPAQVVAGTAPKSPWFAVAPYVHPVRMSLIRWTVYGLLFFGLVQTLNTGRRIQTLTLVLLFMCAFDALYGIVQNYSGWHNIWWYKHHGGVKGTYINRNHFAGLMEMGIVLAVCYAGALAARRPDTPRTQRRRGVRERILAVFAHDNIAQRRFLVIFTGAVMGVGLVLSASRGGILAAGAALLLLGLMLVFRRGQRRMGGIILALFALTAVYSLAAGVDYTVSRFKEMELSIEDRRVVMLDTLRMAADYPLAGLGIGGWQNAYPKYQNMRFKQTSYQYGHNDWTQFLSEAGIIGMILLAAGMGWFLFKYFRIWSTRRDPFAVCLGAVAPAGLAAMAVHSWPDFNLHMPSNFMMLTALLAIGTCALHIERRRDKDIVVFDEHRLPLSRRWIAVPVLLAALMLWCAVGLVRHFAAEAYCNTVPNPTLKLEQNPSESSIREAIRLDGGNSAYHFKLALALGAARDQQAQAQGITDAWHNSVRSIVPALERAIRLNPLNALYHKQLAWEYSYMSRERDYATRWMAAADLAMERAEYFAGESSVDPRMHVEIGNYWTTRTRAFADPARRDVLREKARWHYDRALQMIGGKPLEEEIARYIKNFE